MGTQWATGTVTARNYREPSWPIQQPDAPYQVQLDSGTQCFVPQDDSNFVLAEGAPTPSAQQMAEKQAAMQQQMNRIMQVLTVKLGQ